MTQEELRESTDIDDTFLFFAREYKLCENQFLTLAQSIMITNKNFDEPLQASPDLLINICTNIEGVAKALHRHLAPQYVHTQYYLPFREDEHFDYEALRFLDMAFGLTYKSINISTVLVMLRDDKRTITPLRNASLSIRKTDKDKIPLFDNNNTRPMWCEAYQRCKHNRSSVASADKSLFTARNLVEALGAFYILCVYADTIYKSKVENLSMQEIKLGLYPSILLRPLLDSQVFDIKPAWPYINQLSAEHLSNNILEDFDQVPSSLLVIKDGVKRLHFFRQQYKMLISKTHEEVQNHPSFLIHLKKWKQQHSESKYLDEALRDYVATTKDQAEQQWAAELVCLHSVILNMQNSVQEPSFLSTQDLTPGVYLNTYTHAEWPKESIKGKLFSMPEPTVEDLYDYEAIAHGPI